jgi:uncharacterized repeat protein (TIGR02543 family)
VGAPKTIWVCSDSTGCDQPSRMPFYPLQNYCGVGQYLSKYLTDMTVSNQGEGGLATSSNYHFQNAVSQWKEGDYLYVEYGHNEESAGTYKSNLDKYYTAANEAGVKLIIVGPIDRIQDSRFNSDKQWTSSLSSYSNAGKAFVEEKIAGGANDIAFVDLNEGWIEFLNSETYRVSEVRYNAGMDSEKTRNIAAPRYYYTYNKAGAADRTHINDYGADNAASIFFEEVKKTVAAGETGNASNSEKIQSAVLQDIYKDMNIKASPSAVHDEAVKDGYAPNSLYPDNYTSRVEYPYSASIEDIALNENGTLGIATVRILQDLPQYAAVYVTAYDENNQKLEVITSSTHIDNTSDKQGTIKELEFNSDVVPHHFKATVYYCNQDNERLTDSDYKAAISAKYESRKTLETLLDEDFSELDDEVSAYQNGWNGYGSMTTRTMIKKTDTDGRSYANMISKDGNSSYTWKDLSETVNNKKIEISFKLRYNSGSVNILTGTGRAKNVYGTTNPSIAFSGNSVSFNSNKMGNVNTGEWIDYKYLIDIDNQTATGYVGAYGSSTATVTLNTSDITQLMLDAPSKTAFDVDIKDIKICTVETYDFTTQDEIPTDDPEDMDSVYRRNLLFGGADATDEDDGVFGKNGAVYMLGNTSAGIANWGSDTEKGVSTSANIYANVNIAMDAGSTALLQFGLQGPGVRYQALSFIAGDAGSDESISVTAGEKNRTSNVAITLKPENWYRIEFTADLEKYSGYVTVTDILSGKTVLIADTGNAWGAFSTAYAYWNSSDSTGNVYIANSWMYAKPCGEITADSKNVSLSNTPELIGEKSDVVVTADDGYTLKSINYNGTAFEIADNRATISVRGVSQSQMVNVVVEREEEPKQEAMPEIAIDYTNETLTGFTENGDYLINQSLVTPVDGKIIINREWFGTEISIIKKGDGLSTTDSDVQNLEIPARPDAPKGVATMPAGDIDSNDGKITGVTTDMEYRQSNGEWMNITSTEIVGLACGSYDIRIAASDTGFASEIINVTIGLAEKYVIRFVNYDGEELLKVEVEKNTIPSYDGMPQKPQDDKYTYQFSGWDSELTAATENKIYTAQYEEIPRTYTVILNTNGGTINSGNITSYTYGSAVNLPKDITKDKYTFGGWYTNDDYTGNAISEIPAADTGDKTYYAKWTENSYTISVNTPENGSVNLSKITAKMGEKITVTVTPSDGYKLASLTVNGETVVVTDNSYTFTMPAENVTIVATFVTNETVIPKYTVIITGGEGIEDVKLGTTVGTKTDNTYTFTEIVEGTYTFDVTYLAGYEKSDTSPESITVSESKTTETISAQKKKFTVIFKIEGQDDIKVSNIEYNTAPAGVPNLTDTATRHYLGWVKGTDTATNVINLADERITEDTVYTAKYETLTPQPEKIWLELLPKSKEWLQIEKITVENEVTLSASKKDGSAFDETDKLSVYVAVYDSDILQSVKKVDFEEEENNTLQAIISAPDSENYKVFIWTSNYEPVTEVITSLTSGANKLF